MTFNFNELPAEIKNLIFLENRKKAYKNKYNNVVKQLNKVNEDFGEGCVNPNNNFTLKMFLINQL
jgi:hypothetical protein|tara:strand:+ start:238 stop:432 length:195 start_codon:yes stop_codon:yes gene_type:complete